MSLPGFSYRKTRRLDDALAIYRWALGVEPRHRGASEYLGEPYLDTDRLDKALQQLQVLDHSCTFRCRENSRLEKAIDDYRQAAAIRDKLFA